MTPEKANGAIVARERYFAFETDYAEMQKNFDGKSYSILPRDSDIEYTVYMHRGRLFCVRFQGASGLRTHTFPGFLLAPVSLGVLKCPETMGKRDYVYIRPNILTYLYVLTRDTSRGREEIHNSLANKNLTLFRAIGN